MDWWWLIPIGATVASIVRVCVVASYEFSRSNRRGAGFVTMSAALVYGFLSASIWAVFFAVKWMVSH